MALFQMALQEDEQTEIISVYGDLESGEIGNFIRNCHQEPRQPAVIWDLRQSSWQRIPAADLFMQFSTARKFSMPGFKSALVFGTDADFALGRMVEHYMEEHGSSEQYRTFRSIEEAEIWLRSTRLPHYAMTPLHTEL